MMAFHGGAGVIGALLIGIAGGMLTLAAGQAAMAVTRFLALRIAIATAFAVPAAIAGDNVVFVLSEIAVPSLTWREIFACLGAVCIGGTVWTRMRVVVESRLLERAEMAEQPSSTHSLARHAQEMILRRLPRRTGSRRSAR